MMAQFMSNPLQAKDLTGYNVGVGIHDITGPAGEVVMMGYADTEQVTAGIHQRLRSRAFIVQDTMSDQRVVFVSADLGQIFQGVSQEVLTKLQETFGDLYTEDNVILSATHTHSGPGGYSHYALYNISSYGYIKENYDVIVDGIYNSIVKAHDNLEPGYLEMNTGKLDGTSINRSLEAYNNNGQEERLKYEDNVDKEMVVVNFKNNNDQLLGVLSWFPVHNTSMGKDNCLISSDNKGYASYLFEKEMGTDYTKDKTFVAAFAQSNCGDVSPNIYGGTQGYGDNDFESTQYAGEMQYDKCKELSDSAITKIEGPLNYRHVFKDFSNIIIDPEFTDGVERSTYEAAIGYSFATGAEDGPSYVEGFYEGMTADEYTIDNAETYITHVLRLMNIVPGFNQVSGVNYPDLWEQHYPKPILFATSKATPYPWTPEVLPLQIVRVGQLAIVSVPAEFTTMSGRRVKEMVGTVLDSDGSQNTVVIAGLANAYSGYVATPEEYDLQHYEGASTHFGKWTLSAYLQEYKTLANAIMEGTTIDSDLEPRIIPESDQMTFQTGVVLDNTPIGKSFGDVETQVRAHYTTGETVTVSFWTGHPKNDLKQQSSYFDVEKLEDSGWVRIKADWDWETRYKWERIDSVIGTSLAILEWTVPEHIESGTYRIVHHGAYLNGWDRKVYPFTGYSDEFFIE